MFLLQKLAFEKGNFFPVPIAEPAQGRIMGLIQVIKEGAFSIGMFRLLLLALDSVHVLPRVLR